MISENPIAKSDGWEAATLFPPYETEVDWMKCYPFREIRVQETRALIADKLMAKSYLIWQPDPEKLQPQDQIGHI